MSKSDDLKQAARGAAVARAEEYGDIDDVSVAEPVISNVAIRISVTVRMKDAETRCYEYRCDVKGEHCQLWDMEC